jgi:hypothetical protein
VKEPNPLFVICLGVAVAFSRSCTLIGGRLHSSNPSPSSPPVRSRSIASTFNGRRVEPLKRPPTQRVPTSIAKLIEMSRSYFITLTIKITHEYSTRHFDSPAIVVD